MENSTDVQPDAVHVSTNSFLPSRFSPESDTAGVIAPPMQLPSTLTPGPSVGAEIEYHGVSPSRSPSTPAVEPMTPHDQPTGQLDNTKDAIVPKVGMAFKSEAHAYEMYNSYARKIGFSIRLSNFNVSREEVYTVQKVVLEHNHNLASPNRVHKLRSHRQIQEADKLLIGQIRQAGIKPAEVYEFFKQCQVIKDHPQFLADFKKCVYEESFVASFDKMWSDLLETYELKDNSWLSNLYELRAHWAAVFRDSFTADMTTTQRSEGMNNVFKKRFRRKLCLSELLEELIPMKFQDEAIVVFNSEDMTIMCSCRKYECIGLLCKHTLRVLNINEVFILPTQYILNRWTKYAKRDFYSQRKPISEDETLKTRAAHISRKATSVALKCSGSKELLDNLEKAISKLDLEADNALSQRPAKSSGVSQSSNAYADDILKGKVSIRVPEVIKGKKDKRTNVLEMKTGKKGKNTKTAKKKKGGDLKDAIDNIEVGRAQDEFISSFDASIGANIGLPCFPSNMCGDFSTVTAPSMHQGYTSLGPNIALPYFPSNIGEANIAPSAQGGYSGLLLGVHQDDSVSRRLHFDESLDR
ncbi:hypothetical protein U9M48_014130 [Paspalum notatum var. saurae]|uniref:SWIM-type domain-containing protein n=1 Tax=Paspalum notatum var. saurae TaxID=547442 RepID=A0AAQ3T1B7_PASNO